MWWIIGTFIGIAWNLHEEKKNPELRAKREKDAREGYLSFFIVLSFLALALIIALIASPTASVTPAAVISPNVASSTSPAKESPNLASTIPVPASVAEALPTPEVEAETSATPSYQETIKTSFAKDWVDVDGKRIEGITHVNPASAGMVAILYAEGGKDVPASMLPQGFLDAWQITPEKLKAADNP